MIKFYGVSFKNEGKVYIFKSEAEYCKNDYVIVTTEKGLQYGKVNFLINQDEITINIDTIKEVVRKATNEDKNTYNKNIKDAASAIEKATKYAEKLKLDMKFMDASFTFDRKQLLLNFLADERIDFRELAKKLASIYKTRIELRQIGARDKAKVVGGIGMCGRKLCCSGFLQHMDGVSMSMAKNQNIALNPSKINGCCGRLMCCLSYEDKEYQCCAKGLPQVGRNIKTEFGEGKVVSVDILNRKYIVDINGDKKEVVLK